MIELAGSLPTTLLKRHQLFPQNPHVTRSLNANSHFSSAHFHDRHNDILANDDLLVLQPTQNKHSTFSLKFVVTETNDLAVFNHGGNWLKTIRTKHMIDHSESGNDE